MKSDSFVSVVLAVNQNITEIETILSQIQNELDIHYSDYEIVIMSHGPYRVSKIGNSVDRILQEIPSIRLIQLSGTVHDDVIWAAGLENAIGDFVVLFDHQTDPVSAITGIVDVCKSGTDVVVGVAPQPITPTYKLFRLLSDQVLKAIDYHLPQNSTKLRCLSRRAVNSTTRTGRFHHQFYLRIQKTGYPCGTYSYQLLPKASLKKSFWSGFRYLIRLMVFNSSRPLRWMSGIGMIGSLFAFIFAVYSVVVNLISGHVVAGWTTTILFMSLLFMLQFVMLAFFGEYLGRLLDDRSEQADYSIVFEKNSAVMINQDRVNVLSEATSSENNVVQTGRDR
ncbi:glycosyl transferase family 2 [Yersinia alsatica]|uniref:Glycosyl transferase family 2 n=1 Tax=Yersinia alsatica TaxID=2890317 RepID=A0ABY5US54_9GAMM|nr:glycosyl transferase family 2 [Yersinia alsatica]OWF69783.1 glycosyl transferase family 2 [Yersinia frederiksenii]UWM46313.1 glycosyl transferase family 2 [Yersinia alsatica]CNK46515.1 undecaprenyl phosphate 4-deoxy-4-formamido-L-arabinose transferase [Yersinia frederiksenii]CNL26509.1 undecaprenyl phosphate 4-deoxy-4-formamido-L-arabinose transferase [Yersinia frederiksenii]